MSKHMVVCQECGRQFDVNSEGGYYNSNTRRYTCKKCVKAAKKAYKKAARVTEDNPQGLSWFGRNWKAVVGIAFVLAGIGNIGKEPFGSIAIMLLIGVGLLAWRFLPGILAKKNNRDSQ